MTTWWKKILSQNCCSSSFCSLLWIFAKILRAIWIMEFSFIGQKTGPWASFSWEKFHSFQGSAVHFKFILCCLGVSLPSVGCACSLGCVLVQRDWRECLQVTVLWNFKILKFQALQKIKGYNLSLPVWQHEEFLCTNEFHRHTCKWFVGLQTWIGNSCVANVNEYTVEPRYKEVGYNKPSYNKVILLVPALYISLFFYPDIMRNLK